MSDTVETAAPTAPATTRPVIVAIDGPSGTGKSSTSKAVAAKLGLEYLDTGAQYRALTWWMLTEGIDVNDPAAVAAVAGRPELVSGTDPSSPTITVDGRDATGPIRSEEVTAAVSAVSAVPEVLAGIRKQKAFDWLLHNIEIVDTAGTPVDRDLVLGHTHDDHDHDDHDHDHDHDDHDHDHDHDHAGHDHDHDDDHDDEGE